MNIRKETCYPPRHADYQPPTHEEVASVISMIRGYRVSLATIGNHIGLSHQQVSLIRDGESKISKAAWYVLLQCVGMAEPVQTIKVKAVTEDYFQFIRQRLGISGAAVEAARLYLVEKAGTQVECAKRCNVTQAAVSAIVKRIKNVLGE